MTDNEMLLAMSDILDEKLKPIDGKLERVENRLTKVEDRLTVVEDKLEVVDERLTKVEDKLEVVDERLTKVEDKLDEVDERITQVEGRLTIVEGNQAAISSTLKKIGLTQENDVLPRLQNIESCYTYTYKRYQAGIDQVETMQTDIEVIKSVVSEHSKTLQKIS